MEVARTARPLTGTCGRLGGRLVGRIARRGRRDGSGGASRSVFALRAGGRGRVRVLGGGGPRDGSRLASVVVAYRRAKDGRGLRRSPCVCLAGSAANSFDDKSESWKVSKDVRQKVENAVERLNYEVTVGDVASACGLGLLEAERALQALAVDSLGTLKVTDDGEILYAFGKNFRTVVRSKSIAIRLEPGIAKAKATAAYLVRVGFGTALIASIVIVFAAIVVISSSSKDNDNRRSSSSSSLPMFRLSPFDLYYPYWDPYYYRRRRERMAGGEEMNTLEAIFSFVFGDGDQNEGLEDLKWEAIGQVIRKSGGVVTAEQLAPFLVGEAKEEDPTNPLDMESFVLPALQRFDGRAEVDESGNIVYCFPELQKTAGSAQASDAAMLGYLREREWTFTSASVGQKVSAVGLGLLNVFGIVSFTNILANSSLTAAQVAQTYGGVVSLAIGLLPFLKVYAAGFFAIPLIRFIFNLNTNKGIGERNARRVLAFNRLKQMDPALRRKLESARRYGGTQVLRGAAYSSDKELDEMAMEDFDAKLRGDL